MAKIVYFAFVGLLLTANSAFSEQYYSIINAGSTYPWFTENKSRAEYIDKHLGFISKKLRTEVLSNITSRYFNPTNGDVGKLVSDLNPKEEKLILSIEGNYILVDKNAVKKVSLQEYQEYSKTISNYAELIFGFKLGETTVNEAVSILKLNGAKFISNQSYKGYTDIPVITIQNYDKIPVLKGQAPNHSTLWFVDNKLYQINFDWLPKSLFPSDLAQFNSNNIWGLISDGLTKKYSRELRREDSEESQPHQYFWLNNNRHITLRSYNYDQDGFELTYNDSSLLEKADKVKAEIDQLVQKKEQENKLKDAADKL